MLASVIVASCLSLSARTEITDPVHGTQIDAIVAEAMAKDGIPGVAVAVLDKGKLTHAKGYGFADLEHEIPMRSDSICRIASVTKQFTAAAIMRLVEQGKVGLDDPLSKYVGGFGAIGDEATIRQLLHHTSGITDFTRIGKAWEDVQALDLTPDQIMDLVRKQPKEFEPGSKWAYDNSGYVLLGMVIEKVVEKSYADYVEQDLLADSGLSDTRYGDDVRILKRRAQGYRLVGGEVMNDEMWSMTQPHAAGSIVSTVVDLVRWSERLAAGKIVSEESYAAMITPGKLNDGSDTDYGFGLVIGDLAGKKMIWHNGGIHGFSSQLAHYVEDDVHVAVLVNCGFTNAGTLERAIAKIMLGITEAAIKDLPLSEDEIDACTGKYEGMGIKALIRTDGESLSLAPEGQGVVPLKHQGELRFLGDGALEIGIEFDRETTPASFFYLKQGGGKVKFERVK